MKKILVFAWVLLLGGFFGVRAYGEEVKTERVIEQTERADGREFTLRYRVWTEDPLGREENLCVIILAGESEPPSGDAVLEMQKSIQQVRELGGQAFVCGTEGWQILASVPTEGHFFAPEDRDACLEAARRCVSGAYDAEVVEVLDPRFTITLEERERLESQGARVRLLEKKWVVTWPLTLPQSPDGPWAATLTVEAKQSFPGGTAAVGGEGAGVFTEGWQVAEFAQSKVRVGAPLQGALSLAAATGELLIRSGGF